MLTLTTRNLAILSVFMLTLACSSKEVKPLSDLELAKQLLHEQQSKEIPPAHKVLKVHITQPSKAVIDRPLDIAIEIVANDLIAPITLTYAADENFKLPRKWNFYHQVGFAYGGKKPFGQRPSKEELLARMKAAAEAKKAK